MLMINDVAHAHAKLGILHPPWGMIPLKALKKFLNENIKAFPHFSKACSCNHPEGCYGFEKDRQNERDRRKGNERESLSQLCPSYRQMLGGPAGCPQSFLRCY